MTCNLPDWTEGCAIACTPREPGVVEGRCSAGHDLPMRFAPGANAATEVRAANPSARSVVAKLAAEGVLKFSERPECPMPRVRACHHAACAQLRHHWALQRIMFRWLHDRLLTSNRRSIARARHCRGRLPPRSRFCASIILTICEPERWRSSPLLSSLRSPRDTAMPWRTSRSNWRTRVWTTTSLGRSNVQASASSSRHRRALA